MAERIEVDAIIKAIERGFDEVERKIEDLGDAAEKTEKDFKDTERAADKLADSVDDVGDSSKGTGLSFGKMAGAVALGTAAFEAIKGGIQKVGQALVTVTRLAGEQEAAEKQLATTLESTQHAAGLTAEELKDLASELQNVTTFGDEAIIAAESLLLTFTSIGGDVFPRAQMAVLDVATAMDTDLKSATLQVGKALNDPLLGITALSRAGVQFTETQKETIKTMVAMGDVAGAQGVILKELETQFGGSAAAAAQTFQGRVTQLQNVIGDFGEEIGQEFTPHLATIADELVPALTEAFEELAPEIENMGDAMDTATKAAIPLIRSLSKIIEINRTLKRVQRALLTVGFSELNRAMEEQQNILEETNREWEQMPPHVAAARRQMEQQSGATANLAEEQRRQRNLEMAEYYDDLADAGRELTKEIEGTTEATEDANDEWRDAIQQQQAAASQQRGLNRAMEQGVGVVGDTRDGWETYHEQVEDTTSALRRSEVQFANNRDRLIELKAEAERLEQQFADLTTELLNAALAGDEYDQVTIDNATSTDTLAGIMRDSAAAAGLDAEGRALLAVATGELSMAQAEAVLRAAALQAKAKELGEQIAAGNITIHEAVAALADLQSSFDGMSTLEARAELDELEARLNALNGSEVRVTVRVDEVQGTVVQRGGQGAGISEFDDGDFMSGGFTGNVATNQVAGVVHGQEFVLNAATTRRLGVGNLNALNAGGSLPGSGVTIENMQIILANPVGASADQVGTSVANKLGQRMGRR